MVNTPNLNWLATAMVALLIPLAAVACGSDDEAEPTAVATEAPVATPQATPTPSPIPTPLVESAGSLEDLFITDATTGREVMARVSQPERLPPSRDRRGAVPSPAGRPHEEAGWGSREFRRGFLPWVSDRRQRRAHGPGTGRLPSRKKRPPAAVEQ